MWRKQVDLSCIPYYMFVARDTGAKHYFEIPLEKCWDIFRKAYSQVSGICRTVRGPSMSDEPGKATWFSELRPAFGKDYFFFEHEFPTRPMYGDGFLFE